MHVDVRIEELICTGCGACVNSCPTDVIRMREEKARVAYPDDCQGCFMCEFDCPVDAILIFPRRFSEGELEELWKRMKRTCQVNAEI